MSSQWKAGNRAFDRHLAHQCLLPRGPAIARIHTSDRWEAAPYAHCEGLRSANNKPGSTQCSFIRGLQLWVMYSTLGMWYEVTGEIRNEAASLMHVCNMEPTHYQCIRATSDVTICMGTPDTSLLRMPCVMPSVPQRKERKNEKQSRFYHGSLNIDLLILVYSVPNAISNKNKSLCSRWCWWKQGWGISSGDVCLSYLSLLSEWIRC